MRALSLLAALTVAAAMIVGCTSSKEYKPAVKTSTSLEQAAKTVDKANVQVDDAVAALKVLTQQPGDMTRATKDYIEAVAKLESTQADVNREVASMRANRDAFFSQWEKDVATIQNEDVRNLSAQRKADLQAQFSKVQSDYGQLQKTMNAFMTELRDIRTAIAYNVSAGAIAAIQDPARKAQADAGPVRDALAALSADFRKLGVAVSTTMPAPRVYPAP